MKAKRIHLLLAENKPDNAHLIQEMIKKIEEPQIKLSRVDKWSVGAASLGCETCGVSKRVGSVHPAEFHPQSSAQMLLTANENLFRTQSVQKGGRRWKIHLKPF